MMKTRRKAKQAAAAAEHDGADQSGEDSHLIVPIPDDLDLDTLATLLPDVNYASPSPESIVALYRVLLGQTTDADTTRRELDEARAEVEKKDVELDQALQDCDRLTHDLETTLGKVQGELHQVTQVRDQLASAQASLQSQITALTNSQSSSSTEVDQLRSKVEETDREKRDLLVVIDRLKQESAQREEETTTLRSNLKEARYEQQALESTVRELRSTETSTKFKIETLTQQLELAQSEAERANTELTAKIDEFGKLRRSKQSELASLQASYDSLEQTQATVQAALKSLQSTHTSQVHQLTQASAKVQDLTGQLAEQEATYATEVAGLKRLVGMMEEREKQAKDIVENIEREWAGVGERAERREAALKSEIERERSAREEAEKRADQLEGVLERVGRGELPIPGRVMPGTPSTPVRTPGPLDPLSEGMMTLSPTVAIASKAQKSGKTFTQVYADYVRLQEDYATKCAEYDHMDRTLSAVLAQIEERAPILSQQRAEYERLQSEAAQLGSQLAQTLAERDAKDTLSRETVQKLAKSVQENELLQKQLNDLGRQVQALLREVARRDDPSIPFDEDLEHVAPAEDTESVITNNLVLFKSIGGLQEQNQKLLKIVRELGKKMEDEERDYKDAMELEQSEAIREAHEAMQELASQLERQKKSHEAIVQAYMKERDTLRGMLARVEKTGGNVVSASLHEEAGMPANELAKELEEIQSQFNAYKTEMGIDSERLREEMFIARREIGQLSAALAKSNARIESMTERHLASQEQYNVVSRELDNASKRYQDLYDRWTRIDIACNRASNELQDASSRIEQLRNENANLRAEKNIWNTARTRLEDENKTLHVERSRLSDLMVNVQKMHAELERSGENDRRRLETQLQLLEGQTQDLRTQVSQERDNVRHITLQKDIESKELQSRVDKAALELSKTRESLISAETSKKHLEERVEDLNRLLHGNEEKLAVYERRKASGVASIQPTDQDSNAEQQLQAEIAELRSALKIAEVDLATAKNHVEQFREISQANEEALANLNTTYDEYKSATDAQIARHESEAKALQEKFDSVQAELTQQTAKYNDLQKAFDTERAAWVADKRQLEDTIVDLSNSEKHSENDRSSREQEIKELEDRAKAAEERYSREVVGHAEAIKTVDSIKQQLADAQNAVRVNITSAETANAKLVASEESWKQQKESLDKEIADLSARCKDLTSQNGILHQHLESVSSQAARIRQAADASAVAPTAESEGADNVDTKLAELRSVVAYLRKEKEIIDLQHELGKQEIIHLKNQVKHLSQSLDETTAALSEERERAVENSTSATQHAELIERINQLNILRESNATLRTELETNSRKAKELELKLRAVSQQLDPAKEEARVARAEAEASKGQVQRLEEENRRWQERNTQLLTKYDRTDPAELQSLKDELASLKTEKAEMQQDNTTRAERIEKLEQSLKAHKDAAQRSVQQFKSKLGELNTSRSELVAEKNQLTVKVKDLETEVQNLKTTPPADSTTTSTIASLQAERDALLAEKEAVKATASQTPAAAPNANWEVEKAELTQAREKLQAQVKSFIEHVKKLDNELRGLRFQNNKLSEDLKAAKAEAEAKAKVDAPAPAAGQLQDELVKKHAQELHALEERLNTKHQEELKSVRETIAKEQTAASSSTTALDQQVTIDAAIADYKKSIEAGHATQISSAIERGRLEGAAKFKLKDAQLVKAQKRVKDLETDIERWRAAGLIPAAPAPAPATAPAAPATGQPTSTAPAATLAPASAPKAAAPTATHSTAPATVAATPPANGASTSAAAGTLPRKPSITPGTTAPTAPAGRGRGGAMRGQPRGGASLGRGAAPRPLAAAAAGAAASTSTAAPTGMSIMGAAAKRPREPEAATTNDEASLAKRLKPADATVPPPAAPSKPVVLRRPPPPAPS